MEQENPDARRIAVDSLVRLGAQAAPFAGRVVKLLSHTSEEVRETAIDCLERLGAHAAPVAGSVVRLIESQDVDARSAAAKALGVMGEHAAASAGQLAQLLEHSDKGVRSAVANALGNLGPHASDHAGLVAAMLTSDRSHVRRAALKALGRLKEHAAPFVSEIVPLMEDEDHATRWTAIKVLARLGQAVDTEAVDAIATHLDDPRSEVRVAAVESLAELGHIGNYVSGVVPLLSQISDTKALMASIGALSTVEHTDNSCELMVGALCQLDVHPDPQVQSAARTLLSELSVQLSLTNSKAEDAIETVALSDAHPLPVVSSPEEELTATRQLETNPEPKISHESLQTSTPYVVVQPASVATNVPAQDESSSWITYAAAAGVTAMAVYFMVEFCNRFRGRRASQ